MIELIFVIVIIGILSAVALPKMSSIMEMAYLGKAKDELASMRSGLNNLRQIYILRGEASHQITTSDVNGTLSYGLQICGNSAEKKCWAFDSSDNKKMIYRLVNGKTLVYNITDNSKIECNTSASTADCSLLDR
jgi:general secretion pathway protein G